MNTTINSNPSSNADEEEPRARINTLALRKQIRSGNIQDALGVKVNPSNRTKSYNAMADKLGISDVKEGDWFCVDGLEFHPFGETEDDQICIVDVPEVLPVTGKMFSRYHDASYRLKNIGAFNMHGPWISFVDRSGQLFIGPVLEKNIKALLDAGYVFDEEMWVPFSSGPELSPTFTDKDVNDRYTKFRLDADAAWTAEQKEVKDGTRENPVRKLIRNTGRAAIRIIDVSELESE